MVSGSQTTQYRRNLEPAQSAGCIRLNIDLFAGQVAMWDLKGGNPGQESRSLQSRT